MKKLAIMLFVFFGLGCKSIWSMEANEKFFSEKDLAELQASLDLQQSGNANEQWITMPSGYDTCLTPESPIPQGNALGSTSTAEQQASDLSAKVDRAANFPCKIGACRDVFASDGALRNHMKSIHRSPDSNARYAEFCCEVPQCGAVFKLRYRFLEHQKNHEHHKAPRAQASKQIPCKVQACDDVFFCVNHMDQHVKTNHEPRGLKEANYKCGILNCGAKFSHRKSFENHTSNHAQAEACKHKLAPLPPLEILGSLRLLDLPLLAASGAPGPEEIAARNKRDAELNGSQQGLPSTLPALAAAASPSQATAHSPEKEKVSPPVGAKRPAGTDPESEPSAKRRKSQKKIVAEFDPKYIDIVLKTIPCSVKACNDMFRNEITRDLHAKNNHANKTKKHLCTIRECGAGFDVKPRMKEHMDNHAKAKKTLMDAPKSK